MAVAVVADEGVRHVHAAVGLDVDQAVVAVVDELVALGLLAELREEPLGGLLEPDPAVVVLADDQVGDLGGVGADVPARRRCAPGRRGGVGSGGQRRRR